MPKQERETLPIRQSVVVDCPIEDAFELFTVRFAEWWPLASHSISGEEAESCAIEPWVGGRVYERTRSDDEHDWGSVIAWDPPERVSFTWHPGAGWSGEQTVDVEFRVEADGTRVTLTHRAWQGAAIEACALQAECFSKFASEQMLVAV